MLTVKRPSVRNGQLSDGISTVRRTESGQSLLELAFIIPLVLAMVLGAVEFGRYAYISILVGNAAHAGAIYGSQSLAQSADYTGICMAASKDFQVNTVPRTCTYGAATGGTTANPCPTGNCTSSPVDINSWVSCGCESGGTITYQGQTTDMCSTRGNSTLDPSCSGGASGDFAVIVNVTASGTYNSLFSYPWIPSSISVSRTSTMRVKNE